MSDPQYSGGFLVALLSAEVQQLRRRGMGENAAKLTVGRAAFEQGALLSASAVGLDAEDAVAVVSAMVHELRKCLERNKGDGDSCSG